MTDFAALRPKAYFYLLDDLMIKNQRNIKMCNKTNTQVLWLFELFTK